MQGARQACRTQGKGSIDRACGALGGVQQEAAEAQLRQARAGIEACSRALDEDGSEEPCLGAALAAMRALEALQGAPFQVTLA